MSRKAYIPESFIYCRRPILEGSHRPRPRDPQPERKRSRTARSSHSAVGADAPSRARHPDSPRCGQTDPSPPTPARPHSRAAPTCRKTWRQIATFK